MMAPLERARSVAADVAGRHADIVDAEGRFPAEAMAALKEARLRSAAARAASACLPCRTRIWARIQYPVRKPWRNARDRGLAFKADWWCRMACPTSR